MISEITTKMGWTSFEIHPHRKEKEVVEQFL
jgi:hypothetical protein